MTGWMIPLKTIVVGLGSPIRRDDSVGICVVRLLKERLAAAGVTATEGALIGFNFFDALIGFDKVVIIDAIQTENGEPGDIYKLQLKDIDAGRHMPWSHHFGLVAMLDLANRMGLGAPDEIVLLAIEAEDVEFGDGCTPKVERAIPVAAEAVCSAVGLSS